MIMQTYKHAVRRASRQIPEIPKQWTLTDPDRNPHLVSLAESVPVQSGIIYRHFGQNERFTQAQTAARICRQRGVVLLVSLDPALFRACGANGMHVPEKWLTRLPALRRYFPDLLLTAAAHSARAARRAFHFGADAVLLSPVFPSSSPSAGRPLGLCRTLLAAQDLPGTVIALGGVRYRDLAVLQTHGGGVAMVSGERKTITVKT